MITSGDHDTWSTVALEVALNLPPEEAVPVLRAWCESCALGRGANYYQALAHTNDPRAHEILHHCLVRLRNADDFLMDDGAGNGIAFDAICCLAALLQIGESPEQFHDSYTALMNHPSAATREATQLFLTRYFDPEVAARDQGRLAFG